MTWRAETPPMPVEYCLDRADDCLQESLASDDPELAREWLLMSVEWRIAATGPANDNSSGYGFDSDFG